MKNFSRLGRMRIAACALAALAACAPSLFAADGDPVVEKPKVSTPVTLVDNGDTWIPVRFFNRPLGYALNVDLNTNTVELSNPASP